MFLGPPSLGNVDESADGSVEQAVAQDRANPIFNRKTGSIETIEPFAIDVRGSPLLAVR